MPSSPDVFIVGAGLAGLCCSRTLLESGISSQILEASDGIGGRVRTDAVDGFLCDRGFQVLLTAYPEAKRLLDYTKLDLKPFSPGALSQFAGKMNMLSDPWRMPGLWWKTLQSEFGTLGDKMRVALLRNRVKRTSLEEIFRRPERSALDALRSASFSEEMIRRFFRPFLGGILLDAELKSSSRMFEFIFKMLAEGDTAVPTVGMGAIAAQLVEKLPGNAIRLNASVEQLHDNELKLSGGETLHVRAIVVAADGPSAAHLVGEAKPASRSVTCFYYAADEAPVNYPMIVLNGEGAGPVNNFAVMSHAAPSYAPVGQHLISLSVLGIQNLTDAQLGGFIIAQMTNWFGKGARSWRFLKSYRIPHAQLCCGRSSRHASINGAMVSGRRAAEAVLADFAR